MLPLIDYCCVVWGNCNGEDFNIILKLQKRALRIILDTEQFAPSGPLFKQLHLMTVQQRIKYHESMLLCKSINQEAPSYLVDKLCYI